ncbi:hypothetical protein ABT394_24790 [Streptomyces halstedii]|uniref:hypothetical protein n=1 Tax=Streptomyces halstedii TaxID=1944 RepID=UPI003360AA26
MERTGQRREGDVHRLAGRGGRAAPADDAAGARRAGRADLGPRPLKVGQDALAGIAELANIAAAAGADEVVLAWETHDVATACELPIVGPAPCLNMVLATPAGHVLHQFPYTEQLLSRSPEGWASVAPDWRPAAAPQPGGELVPPIKAAVNFSFTPIELDHPDPFGVTVVLMEQDGYRISLTEAFAR